MWRIFTFLLLLTTAGLAAQEALWLRYPAISPDGTTIVFSYQGDLYRVPADGGAAMPLTLHEAYDFRPVWSADGKHIAFASDRYGNFDVFVMPANGGRAERLTYHSANDYPSDFTADGKEVLFSSSRLDAASNQQYPYGLLGELYAIGVGGGQPRQVITMPAENARLSADGRTLVFHDNKGYEDPFRKHHTSSVTRDLWTYNLQNGQYRELSGFAGEDREAVFAPGGEAVYYLTEEQGSFNIHKMDLRGAAASTPVTRLKDHPVRNLSASRDGRLAFSYDGQLYTVREGEAPVKVPVLIALDDRHNAEKIQKINGDVTDMALSPNGKEVAFVSRGEVFVASAESGTTKRVTNTPEQERSVSFSPDGRSLLYAGERDGSWNVYRSQLVRKEELYFFSATLLEEKPVIATPAEEFQPSWSPDGKEVAYLEERTTLKVVDLATGKTRQILSGDRNYSYSDGDQHYDWSSDGKWFLVQFLEPRQWIDQVGLVSADGQGEVINLTKSGYSNGTPQWMMNGEMVLWFSDRDGLKNDASWGGQLDAYAMFFTQEAYDRFTLNKEDYTLLKEREEAEKKENEAEKEQEDSKKEDAKPAEPLKIELDGIEDRKARLTIHSADMAGALVTPDGEKLFYLAKVEKGYDLWQTDLRTKDTKILAKLGAERAGDLELDKEGKKLYLQADGHVHKVNVEDGKREKVGINGEMVLNEAAEREHLFEHVVRQVSRKFYKTDLHEVDWEMYRAAYERFLPYVNNNYDFAELLSEMLGELNASHTGARYRPNHPEGDKTAALGLFYDEGYTGNGMKVREVMAKSPVAKSHTKIKPGVIIEKIDGVAITPQVNFYGQLNRKEGRNTLLSLYDPASGRRWEETVKPISLGEESELRYERWVENSRKLVEELSGGKIGYVHVRGMNDPSYRTVYEDVLGHNAGKEALVVDTRFNGGGWLHDDLATFLSGVPYLTFMPRGQDLGMEPQFKWAKPSAVVMGEGNYSDAHMFPYAYKALGIGKLIGMPVPGTGTAVWWERLQNGIVFGIPQVGMLTADGKYLENTQLEPDIKVPNEPGALSRGEDQQLEAAVRELQRTLEEKEKSKAVKPKP